jgi:antitoxin component HigA of HigAB toxin-antitoxin module
MDEHGMSRADLVPLLGTPSRVTEVLTGKRDLSENVRNHLFRFALTSPAHAEPSATDRIGRDLLSHQ